MVTYCLPFLASLHTPTDRQKCRCHSVTLVAGSAHPTHFTLHLHASLLLSIGLWYACKVALIYTLHRAVTFTCSHVRARALLVCVLCSVSCTQAVRLTSILARAALLWLARYPLTLAGHVI